MPAKKALHGSNTHNIAASLIRLFADFDQRKPPATGGFFILTQGCRSSFNAVAPKRTDGNPGQRQHTAISF
jgi:hypothetical protein